jgi:hypothetical protein
LAPLRGAILLRAARAKYLYEYRKVAKILLAVVRQRFWKSRSTERVAQNGA